MLAVDLFGDADDWAGGEGTFLRRDEVDALLEGLEVVRLREVRQDARSFVGPKHWHRYSVLARAPRAAGGAEPGGGADPPFIECSTKARTLGS